MKEHSKALAYASLSAATGTVILYLGSVLPTARLALLCVSSIGVVLMALRFEPRWAWGVFGVTGLLSLLLLPEKMLALAYLLLPGWYPLLKLRLERMSRPLWRYGGKMLAMNLVLLAVLLLGRDLLAAQPMPLWFFWLGGNIVFLVYDYALTQIILLYMRKIAGRIK